MNHPLLIGKLKYIGTITRLIKYSVYLIQL
nr:MAG TPA: hypothetical protein [Caudoviricetes sp.]